MTKEVGGAYSTLVWECRVRTLDQARCPPLQKFGRKTMNSLAAAHSPGEINAKAMK